MMKKIKVGKRVFVRVRAEVILIDGDYQRQCFDEVRARRIGREFDPNRFGTPVCSLRSDGGLYAIDGQHRVRGLVLEDLGHKVIEVQVLEGYSVEQEAELFWQINGPGGGRKVKAFDNYRARLVFHEPLAVEVDAIVSAEGLRVAQHPSAHAVGAIGEMEKAHKRNANLATTLSVLHSWAKAIGDNGKTYDKLLIRCTSDFLADYETADHQMLARKLMKLTPDNVKNRINLECTAFKGTETKRQVANTVLVSIYNAGRGKKLKRA